MPPILRFLQREQHATDALLQSVVANCRAELARFAADARTVMDGAQLRGYLRAHAAALVQCELARRGARAAGDEQLRDAATERLVRDVLEDRPAAPILAMPTPHIAARAA